MKSKMILNFSCAILCKEYSRLGVNLSVSFKANTLNHKKVNNGIKSVFGLMLDEHTIDLIS